MARRDEGVGDLVDGGDPLAADALGVAGELLEPLPQEGDVLVVLAQLVRAGHHLALGDPLLEVVHLAVQHEQLEGVVQLGAALGAEVAQPGVQLVHLGEPGGDLLALRVAVGDELPGALSQLPHVVGEVVHGRLQGVVLLHQVLGGELVLAAVLHHHVKLLFRKSKKT